VAWRIRPRCRVKSREEKAKRREEKAKRREDRGKSKEERGKRREEKAKRREERAERKEQRGKRREEKAKRREERGERREERGERREERGERREERGERREESEEELRVSVMRGEKMMSRAYGRSRGFVLLAFLAGGFLAGCDNPQAKPYTVTYTVTFEAKGGSSVQAQDVASGGTATEPSPAPTKTNLDFGGWHTDDTTFSDATKWNFDTAVTEPITLYAKWTATVSFNTNGGSSVADQIVTEGGRATKPSYTPSRSDMASFYDWYVNKTKWNFASSTVTAHTTIDVAYKAKDVYGNEIVLTKNGTPSTSARSIPEYVAFPFAVSGSPIGLITTRWYWDGEPISGASEFPWTMPPYSKAPGSSYLLSVEIKSGSDTYKGQCRVTITENEV
jgi:uncharacterized repeat protein (TIGR02543 family)